MPFLRFLFHNGMSFSIKHTKTFARFTLQMYATGLLPAVLVSVALLCSLSAAEILYCQDGLAFSGIVDGHPIGDHVEMTVYDAWPSSISGIGNAAFVGGVFDGASIWLLPNSASMIVRVNISSGEMEGFGAWPSSVNNIGNGAFAGGAFDGESIWLTPWESKVVVRFSITNGTMTAFGEWPSGLVNIGNGAVQGSVYDGRSVWFVPFNVDAVVRVSTDDGNMTGYSSWPSGVSSGGYLGGVFDGARVWLVPSNANAVVSVNISDGSMSAYTQFPSGVTTGAAAFQGGTFDGRSVWLVPHNATMIVLIDVDHGTMRALDSWPSSFSTASSFGTFAFQGALFDSVAVWLMPKDARAKPHRRHPRLHYQPQQQSRTQLQYRPYRAQSEVTVPQTTRSTQRCNSIPAYASAGVHGLPRHVRSALRPQTSCRTAVCVLLVITTSPSASYVYMW